MNLAHMQVNSPSSADFVLDPGFDIAGPLQSNDVIGFKRAVTAALGFDLHGRVVDAEILS